MPLSYGAFMEKTITEQILETLNPKLSERIRELKSLIDRTDDLDELVLAREDIFSLLKEFPGNPRLKTLLKKANVKIKRLK